MKETLYADVIVDKSLENLDKPYQYKIPDVYTGRIKVGSAVMIPFGKGNRLIKGYVIGIGKEPKFDVNKIKYIKQLPDENLSVTEQLLSLAFWIKERYGCTTNEAIKTVMPVKRKVKNVEKRTIILRIEEEKAKAVYAELKSKSNAAARLRILGALLDSPDKKLDYSETIKNLSVSKQSFNSLINDGIISIEAEQIYRNPNMYGGEEIGQHILTNEQKEVVSSLINEYEDLTVKTVLLHGVTGSGKTEVYMQLIEHVLSEGKQVIVLIPEIALTYQNSKRFFERFGDSVSVLNSRMSAGERYDQYMRASNGDVDIIIGPRSAIFAPFEKLGLIIIDEEHENSYKSENIPRYDAVSVAKKRAELSGAMVVLGSATPSVETYYRTTDEYKGDRPVKLLELKNRVNGKSLPEVNIVDMREEFKKKNYSIISDNLREKIEERLKNRQQVILFINRRGYAGFISCRSCGEVIKCPHCDVSLTMHYTGKRENERKLVCHYCGYESEMVKKCPSCASEYIGSFGQGTQKVEEYIKTAFPDARVLRMDADTTTGKEGHATILEKFARHEADILVGTQMIIKGHDFPEVTLVGVLAADTALNISEYDAPENCFQMIVQAAGRAGRGNVPGEVIVQTYQPEHYAVVTAANQDYASFYARDMMYRRLMKYPPSAHVMSMTITSPDEMVAIRLIEDIAKNTKLYFKNDESVNVIGPSPHHIVKVSDIYRYVLYVKGPDAQGMKVLRDKVSDYLDNKYKELKYTFTVQLQ